MNNEYLLRIIGILFASFLSCCGGLSDVHINLGDGFYNVGEGENYIYFSDNQKRPSIDSIFVYPNVSSYSHKGDSIIVEQIPNRETIREWLIFSNQISCHQADSIMNNNSYFKNLFLNDTNYWVIIKSNKMMKGPFPNLQ